MTSTDLAVSSSQAVEQLHRPPVIVGRIIDSHAVDLIDDQAIVRADVPRQRPHLLYVVTGSIGFLLVAVVIVLAAWATILDAQ